MQENIIYTGLLVIPAGSRKHVKKGDAVRSEIMYKQKTRSQKKLIAQRVQQDQKSSKTSKTSDKIKL